MFNFDFDDFFCVVDGVVIGVLFDDSVVEGVWMVGGFLFVKLVLVFFGW
jgi:hypothetical protein